MVTPHIDGGSRGNPDPAGYGVSALDVKSDSELPLRQRPDGYRVKNAGLQPPFERAAQRVQHIRHVTLAHVRRAFSTDADRLANQAMDEAAAS